MTKAADSNLQSQGLRERKRRETLQRITDTGIRLFISRGYEATTIDEIAAAAAISRRTFFYYFKSKDDILLSLQSGMSQLLISSLQNELETSEPELEAREPLDAIRNAIINVCAPYPTADMVAIDRLMRSNEAVQARKQATYIRYEVALFETLRRKWSLPEQEMRMRLVAMIGVGAMRIAFDTLSREDNRSIVDILNETFNSLVSDSTPIDDAPTERPTI